MKNIVILIIAAIAVFNTLFGVMIDGYEMENCMLVNLSLALTAGICYWLFASKIADALKITITFVFLLTGLVRAALMLFTPSNGIVLTFVGILLLEAVIMAIANYNTSK